MGRNFSAWGLWVSIVLVVAPTAWANRLQRFVYDPPQNRVEFSLTADAQPNGTVIFNPLRIVIDLPNVDYRGGTIKRQLGKAIDSIRIGKSDATTTRLVLEFAPHVQFDPTSLRLSTDNLGNWVLNLPPQAAVQPTHGVTNSLGWMQPVAGQISDGFGYRIHPILGDRRLHRGIDFSAPVGTPIWAVADGTVITAEWDDNYGNFIEIRHADGIVTLYAHADKLFVTKGQRVQRGEAVAAVGSTGRSSGPHLHFEVLPDGKNPVDPIAYLTGSANSRLVLNLN